VMLASEPYETLAKYAVTERRSPRHRDSHPPVPDWDSRGAAR
jgi:hypothetical protein